MASNDSHILVDISNSTTRHILTSLEVIIEQGDSFEIIDVMSPSSNGKRLSMDQLTAIHLVGYEAVKNGMIFMDIFIAVCSAILLSKYRLAIILKVIASDVINGMLIKYQLLIISTIRFRTIKQGSPQIYTTPKISNHQAEKKNKRDAQGEKSVSILFSVYPINKRGPTNDGEMYELQSL
ncbi:uncharacterized protein BX664DRAFT_388870 [Halteromyces radiatus]|uniref:uncharacterized protein n=1 Tax=Halteromyces radiatus TaxID=101107 RepID=UPI00222002EC|nr:uncharacterized protein BX664DRAFT_388870 [Halteromyces radiatus]KAI8079905.1 hypothetical protein BX664DRAFT_388870 [Halteromyces radiatus]